MTKDWPGATYTAWRRSLRSGKTEYKSVTVAEDATAEEFMVRTHLHCADRQGAASAPTLPGPWPCRPRSHLNVPPIPSRTSTSTTIRGPSGTA